MNSELKPKIRFKGFTDDWEQRKLGEIGNTFTGLSGKTKEDFGHGEAKFVTYMNVFNNPIAQLNKTEPIEIDNKQNQVEYGDVFFTTSSETPDEVGMSSVWLENKGNIYLNSFCFGFRPFIKNDPYYMAYMLRANNFRKNITLLAQGISRYNISKTGVMNIDIQLPNNQEQERIGKLFNELDNLITLHQRKCDKLVELKKSLLEKMFPQNNSVIPEIRFKGFTDDWEQRKLGEIINETIDNRGKNPPYYCESGIPIIDNFMIKNNGYPDLKIATRYLDDYLFSNFIRKYNEKDDVLITLVGNGIGNIALFPKEKSAIVQNTIGMRFEHPKKFKYYSLLSKNNEIVKLDRGMAQPSIRQDELKNLDINLPTEKEQSKIESLMTNLDNLITLHQRNSI